MAKIILFGDSIFAGYHNGFTSSIFKTKMQQLCPNDTIVNASVPGATTTDALGWVNNLVVAEEPDLVILFFGANDISTTNYITETIYQNQLQALIDQIGASKVILVTPPYSDSRRLGERNLALIQNYVTSAELVAKQNNLPCVALLDIMLAEKNPDQLLLQPDGIHFTEVAYDLLAGHIFRAIQRWRDGR
ncbi:SGNH/GDSL hydrolase family protein [Agrilactobacillus yilanensis]|uniref:SGNH/GDSL hydrolase family protein n=1 Tax=Agrilactobacillus yilanensis TaxID=2485997 RepID=A0ABW4J651_9LACO|nr:GDSL-type esterase/lipase family protein [Agrilactobacillus yilanensis]